MNNPIQLLESILVQMIPDPIKEYEFADKENIIVLTKTGRMFLVTAKDDKSFEVTELDATQFGGEKE